MKLTRLQSSVLIPSILALSLMAVTTARQGFDINQWSLTYWRHTANGLDNRPAMPAMPHRRAAIWLAADAVEDRDVSAAQSYLTHAPSSDDPFFARVIGWSALLNGDQEAALRAWKETGDYRSLADAAATLERGGRVADSFNALRAAQAVNPQFGTKPLVDFLLRHDAPEEAATVLAEAIQRLPPSTDSISLYRQLGQLLIDQGDWRRASAIYEDLAAVDLVEGAIQLGWLTYAQGEGVERAAAQFDRATAATPRRGGGHYQKARLFALEKRYADADEMFALALRREPGRKEWLVAYATNARNAGDLATAINRYGEVLRRFPNHANAYHELAEAYRLSGMVKAAIDASQAAIGLSDKPRWAYHLRAARLYESIGEGEEAAEQYRIVLNLDSANNTALDALERLQANE